MRKLPVGRTTKTISISVPPEMEAQIQDLMRAEGRTRSELFREALRHYVEDRSVQRISREVSEKAAAAGVTTEEQVVRMVHEGRDRGE